jgi:hypothetical protein
VRKLEEPTDTVSHLLFGPTLPTLGSFRGFPIWPSELSNVSVDSLVHREYVKRFRLKLAL